MRAAKGKRQTHESGTLEQPKVETYEENGVNWTRAGQIGYEITDIPVWIRKNSTDKTYGLCKTADNLTILCEGYEKPAHSVNET